MNDEEAVIEIDHYSGRPALLEAVLRSHAEAGPDRVWCELDGRRHTYAELDRGANRVARALADDFAVRPGDVVGVYMDNRVEYFHAIFAIMRLGAIYVPFSTRAAPPELQYQMRHCEAKVVITDSLAVDGLTRMAHDSGDDAPTAFEIDSDLSGYSTENLDGPEVRAEDLAMIMYTSGTTSRPRGVAFTHGNLRAAADVAERAFRWTPGDRYLHYFPLYHSNGGLHGVMPAVLAGATLVMVPRFSASRFGQQLHDLDITFCAVNATHVRMIMSHPEGPADREHSAWRMMLGLSLGQAERCAFEDRFGTRLCPTYGLTEGIAITAIGEPVGPRGTGSACRVVPGYRVRLVDDTGRPVPPGTPGEAEIRADHRHGITPGYFRDPAATAAAFRDGWLRTGDVLRSDGDGWLTFVERRKDMIKRSGFNVAPAEVERVIAALPGVLEVAVVGVPDPVREEAVVAFVAAGGGLTASEVISTCASELAEYKVPQVVEFVDALPRDVLGKVDKKALRARVLGRAGTPVPGADP